MALTGGQETQLHVVCINVLQTCKDMHGFSREQVQLKSEPMGKPAIPGLPKKQQ